MYENEIEKAKEKFGELLKKQLTRVEEMKAQGDFVDYKSLDKIVIGVCGGDGIGPAIIFPLAPSSPSYISGIILAGIR